MEVSVGGTPVALYNVGGTVYATTNVCLHRGGPLGQGLLEGRSVLCPWHAWAWDVASGENVANPQLKIATYEVRVENGDVLVRV
jgi:nitrite reductase/ring-hydroxylating ferredoxin subunit